MGRILKLMIVLCCLLLSFQVSAEIIRSFQYDANNNVIKEIKGDGSSISYEYNSSGKLLKEISSDNVVIEYSYDKNGNCIEMVDAQGTTHYGYDNFNQLISVQFPQCNPFSYRYDLLGRPIEIIYPSGQKIFYRYDQANRLSAVMDQSGKTEYTYDNLTNVLIKISLPNGVKTEYAYDRAGRIIDVRHKCGDERLIAGYRYSFDQNGNRTRIEETRPDSTKIIECQYDKLNRLIFVKTSDNFEKYSYDEIGNRLTKETPEGLIRYEYDKTNHLVKMDDKQFFYDSSGNLIKKISSKETVEYVYDVHDNLIEFRNGKKTVKYGYDGAGHRISKNIDGVMIRYVNDVRSPLPLVALKTNESNQVCSQYTYGLSRLSCTVNSENFFYLHDYPDRSVIALIDVHQHEVGRYRYDSFGCLQNSLPDISNDFLYAGEAYEEESGLIFLRNRYYDPELGRFISADPEFGSKFNAQSLNPYTYVNNNPLNYIDPTGLRSAKACAYPAGTQTEHGRSSIGHGFWELTKDNGEVITIGRYPGGRKNSYLENHDKICPGTAYYEWPATDEQIEQIRKEVKRGVYLGVAGNCINGLETGLKVLGVEHPSLSAGGISTPVKAVIWLESLNGRTDYQDLIQEDMRLVENPENYVPRISTAGVSSSSFSSGDVGGVSLNKTAHLLGHISEVAGATYDDATGQLIIIGHKNLSLPKMDFDDLAVAVRSIYGLGGQMPQDPGVSLDMDPDYPIDFEKIKNEQKYTGALVARYDGQTKNTRFGLIMFEADRILKCLTFGIDNVSKKNIDVNIPGYETLINRYKKCKDLKKTATTRFWFVPKEMSIYKAPDGKSIVFNKAQMKVLTETTYKNKKKGNSEAEDFADHFTKNYDKFARQFPVLSELRRLGKITAIVKWIKENKIPMDLSLFRKYKPIPCKTPRRTPPLCYMINKEGIALTIVGGVVYSLDESNFQEVVTAGCTPMGEAALKARPSENVFSWTFTSPFNQVEYQAVAQTIEHTAKVGNIKKSFKDMSFPVSGDYPLELVRFYNSFNDQDVGLGCGWDLVPTKLRFPRPRVNIQWNNSPVQATLFPEIYVEENGHEYCYKLIGLGGSQEPLYKSKECQHILSEINHEFILNKTNGKQLTFNLDGKILSKSSYNIKQLTYRYLDNRLVEIFHFHRKKIELKYDQNRLVYATGPGGKVIHYSYDENGQLKNVADSLGILASYEYDNDKNLSAICNSKNEKIFEASYDDYHRSVTEINQGIKQTKTFDLNARTSHVDKMGEISFFNNYDSNHRLLQATDSLNRVVKMSYEEGVSNPKVITDSLGNEKIYTYDLHGNVTCIRDSNGNEQRFWYDQNDHRTAYLDCMGNVELYFYNERGKLIKIYHSARVVAENENGGANFNCDPSYVTDYEYDSRLGLLTCIRKGGEPVQYFTYDAQGLPTSVSGPQGYKLNCSYDERGRVIKLWDNFNEGFEYTYDDRDQVLSLSGSSGKIEYLYDEVGNLSTIKDACGGVTYFGYDAYSNLKEIKDPAGGLTNYEYDANHNLKRVILPNGSLRQISYDTLNRPTADVW